MKKILLTVGLVASSIAGADPAIVKPHAVCESCGLGRHVCEETAIDNPDLEYRFDWKHKQGASILFAPWLNIQQYRNARNGQIIKAWCYSTHMFVGATAQVDVRQEGFTNVFFGSDTSNGLICGGMGGTL